MSRKAQMRPLAEASLWGVKEDSCILQIQEGWGLLLDVVEESSSVVRSKLRCEMDEIQTYPVKTACHHWKLLKPALVLNDTGCGLFSTTPHNLK